MDIRTSLAAQTYAALRPATAPDAGSAGTTTAAIASAVGSFARTLERGEGTALAAMSGRADPHALVTALAESQLAIETAVTVRDRVVEAYQEILRMQV
jgi:flagellar hook-basal body complex protein FliE